MKKRILIIGASIAASIGIAYLYFAPPLIPTASLRATCTIDGKPVDGVRVFKPLFVSDVHYIRLPQPVHRYYQWFLIRWTQNSVSLPVAIWKADSAFKHVHRDQIKGVNLQNPKAEDGWNVVFDKTTVRFANSKIEIKAEQP